MNIRRFTMDEGMAALGNIGSQARTTREGRQFTGPSTVFARQTLSFQAQRRSDDRLNHREDLRTRGILLDLPQVSPKYLAASCSVS